MKKIIISSALVLTLMLAGNTAASAADSSPAMPTEAQMQEMMKLSSPGENHKLLAPLAGEWEVTSRFWMAPDAPVQESKGSSSAALVYDGRFLEEKFSGMMEMNGQKMPFTGTGVTGYDNVSGEFTGIWYDSMSTGMAISKGSYDAKAGTITFKGEMSCPMTGDKNAPFRSVLTFGTADSHSFAMYSLDKSGKEFKAMEISYTRKK